jgi:transposase
MGYPVAEIENITGCTRSSLMNWCRSYREQGLSGLQDHRRGGNHRKLSPTQRADLQERLDLYTPRDVFGPHTQTSSGQFWTIEDLARAIQKWYGVLYQCRMSYLLLLNACGYSYQRSEQVYRSRREMDVADFAEQLEKK